MVRVIPFKAYRYDESKVKDLSQVVTPPYDVIKGEKVDEFQGLSEYNIAWIIKNKPEEADTSHNNQYTRAGSLLNKWIDDSILVPDDRESFYVYGQDFKVDGKSLFRFGFIGLIKLEEFAKDVQVSKNAFKGVLQHEETFPKDIQDRLNLSRNCMTQFGQIFVIYPDNKGDVDGILEKYMKDVPTTDITDSEGLRHRLWRIDNPEDSMMITKHMENKYVIIADGHHRYKTALALSEENPDLETAKYRMLTFVNMSNPGLVILPTHRRIQNLEAFSKEKLVEQLNAHFKVVEFKSKDGMFELMNKQFEEGNHAFGLFMDDGKFYALTLMDKRIMDELLQDKSEELRGLDVAILHALILDKMLGINRKKLTAGSIKGGGYMTYIKGIGDAIDDSIRAVEGDAQAVFFMNPTRIGEVEAVSRNFEVMPQKSTFFHPKIFTGFCINVL